MKTSSSNNFWLSTLYRCWCYAFSVLARSSWYTKAKKLFVSQSSKAGISEFCIVQKTWFETMARVGEITLLHTRLFFSLGDKDEWPHSWIVCQARGWGHCKKSLRNCLPSEGWGNRKIQRWIICKAKENR